MLPTENQSHRENIKALANDMMTEKGLRFFLFAYAVLLTGVLLLMGLSFVFTSQMAGFMASNHAYQEDVVFWGKAVVWCTGITAFVLWAIGQWTCLVFAPSSNSARDLMFAAVISFVIGTLFHLISILWGGFESYYQLHYNVSTFENVFYLNPANLLQALGILLGFLSFALFNGYMRMLKPFFQKGARLWGIDLLLVYMSIVVGGTLGVYFYSARLESQPDLVFMVGLAWAFGFFWHLCRLQNLRRAIQFRLSGAESLEASDNPVAWQNIPESLSGLRRTMQTLENDGGRSKLMGMPVIAAYKPKQ